MWRWLWNWQKVKGTILVSAAWFVCTQLPHLYQIMKLLSTELDDKQIIYKTWQLKTKTDSEIL
jgi:hypothetical protein